MNREHGLSTVRNPHRERIRSYWATKLAGGDARAFLPRRPLVSPISRAEVCARNLHLGGRKLISEARAYWAHRLSHACHPGPCLTRLMLFTPLARTGWFTDAHLAMAKRCQGCAEWLRTGAHP